jgi:uridine kinase
VKDEILAKPIIGGMPVRIIAIDGHGGAGKSTLAERLAKELDAGIIHTDDFASPDNPIDWWPKLIDQVLKPIKNGAKLLSYQPSSWWPDHHPKPVINQPVKDIMILEGVSSSRREFRPYLSFSIWVETPKEICIQRGLERDGPQAQEQWETWWAKEEEYIVRDNPRAHADKIVRGL